MTYKITNPQNVAFVFGSVTLSPGGNEVRDELPATVLQGMRDAGMTVEVTSKVPARPVAQPSAKPPEAPVVSGEGAEHAAPRGRFARGSSREE
jgi:hypothetical protein